MFCYHIQDDNREAGNKVNTAQKLIAKIDKLELIFPLLFFNIWLKFIYKNLQTN